MVSLTPELSLNKSPASAAPGHVAQSSVDTTNHSANATSIGGDNGLPHYQSHLGVL